LIASDHSKIKIFNIIMVLALAFSLVAAAIVIKTTVVEASVNVSPIAEAGPDQAVQGTTPLTFSSATQVSSSSHGGPYPTVYLDGSMSDDQNPGQKANLKYAWAQITPVAPYVGGEWPSAGGTAVITPTGSPLGITATVTLPSAGLYMFKLTVTDDGVDQSGNPDPKSASDTVVVIAGNTWFVRICGNNSYDGAYYNHTAETSPTLDRGAWRTITWATSDANTFVKNGDRILVGATVSTPAYEASFCPFGGSDYDTTWPENIVVDKWLTVQSVFGRAYTTIDVTAQTDGGSGPAQVVSITWPSGANNNVLANGVVFGSASTAFTMAGASAPSVADHGFTVSGAPKGIVATGAPDGVNILWNKVTDFNFYSSPIYCGIQIENSKMPVVDNNIVNDAGDNTCTDFIGILLENCPAGLVISPYGGGLTISVGAQVTNNDVIGRAKQIVSGIELYNCPVSYVYNNDITGPSTNNNRLQGGVSNYVQACGIQLLGDGQYSIIDTNRIAVSVTFYVAAVAYGIQVDTYYSSKITVSNNVVDVYEASGTVSTQFGSALAIGIDMEYAVNSVVHGNDILVDAFASASADASVVDASVGVSSLGDEQLDQMQSAIDGIFGQARSAVVAHTGGLAIGIYAFSCPFIQIYSNTPVDVSCYVCLSSVNEAHIGATVAVGAGASIAMGITVIASTAPAIYMNTAVSANADLSAIVTSADGSTPVIAVGHVSSYGLGILVAFCASYSSYVATVSANEVSASGSLYADVTADDNAASATSGNLNDGALDLLGSALEQANGTVGNSLSKGLNFVENLTVTGDATSAQLGALGDTEALACGIGITTLLSPGAKILSNTVSGNSEEPYTMTGTIANYLSGVHMAGINLDVVGSVNTHGTGDAVAEGAGLALGIGILDAWCGGLNLPFEAPVSSLGRDESITIYKKDANGHIINISGATFTITPNPFTGSGSLTGVEDNGTYDENDTFGTIKLDDVRDGTYSITETAAPTGYAIDTTNPRPATVSHNSHHPTVTFVDGVLATGDLVFVVHDNYGQTVHLPGASFSISPDPFSSASSIVVYDNGSLLSGGDSNYNYGVIKLEDVPFNVYTITQTGAAAGYASDPNSDTVTVDSEHPPVFSLFTDPYAQQDYASLTAVKTQVIGNIVNLGDATAYAKTDFEAAKVVSDSEASWADGVGKAVGLGIAVVGCDPLFRDNGSDTSCPPSTRLTTALVSLNSVNVLGDSHLTVEAYQLVPDDNAYAQGLSIGIGVGITVCGLAFPEITNNPSVQQVTVVNDQYVLSPLAADITGKVQGVGCANATVNASSVQSDDPQAVGVAVALGAGIAAVWCTDPTITGNCNFHSVVEEMGTPSHPAGPWVTGNATAVGTTNADEDALLLIHAQSSYAFGASVAAGIGILVLGCDAGDVEYNHATGGTDVDNVSCTVNVSSYEESVLDSATSEALGLSLADGILLADLMDMQYTRCDSDVTQIGPSNTFESGADITVVVSASADYTTVLPLGAAAGIDALIFDVENVVFNYNDMPGDLISSAVGPAVAFDAGMLVVFATYVDARYNWWGDKTGPSGYGFGGGHGSGQALYAYAAPVDFQPWLADIHEWCIDAHVGKFGKAISYSACWNTFSVPIALDTDYDTWGEFRALNTDFASKAPLAVYYDGSAWQPVASGYSLKPLDGIKVYISDATYVFILAATGDSMGSTYRTLRDGWNLVGPNPVFCHSSIDARDFVSSIVRTDGTGFSQLISQGGSQVNWSYTLGDWISNGTNNPDLLIGKAYWVWLNTDGLQLAGFGFTPLGLYPD